MRVYLPKDKQGEQIQRKVRLRCALEFLQFRFKTLILNYNQVRNYIYDNIQGVLDMQLFVYAHIKKNTHASTHTMIWTSYVGVHSRLQLQFAVEFFLQI